MRENIRTFVTNVKDGKRLQKNDERNKDIYYLYRMFRIIKII